VFFRKGGYGFCVLVFLCSYFVQTERKWVTWEEDGTDHAVLLGFPHARFGNIGYIVFPTWEVCLIINVRRHKYNITAPLNN